MSKKNAFARPGVLFLTLALATSVLETTAFPQIPGPNVNMVTGTQWPGGDPFLQRQNEPSMAVSSRNPLHLLAGANDYRSVDLPGLSGMVEPNADAWLGLFKSFDGGQTWTSTLVPGYPQDQSPAGLASPLKGLAAAADPAVRAGANGLFHYSGIAFDREDGGLSKVFVATYIDDNNLEGGDTINYLWSTIVATPKREGFDDKPAIAVDIPRTGAVTCSIPATSTRPAQTFPGGRIYAAWTEFSARDDMSPSIIQFSSSSDCGRTWNKPITVSDPDTKLNQGTTIAIDPNSGAVYIAWRVFTAVAHLDSIVYVASNDGGKTFSDPLTVAAINPFDQADTNYSFRTNSYPTMATDAAGRVYIAWSQRGDGSVCTGSCGDARIQLVTGTPFLKGKKQSLHLSAPLAIDPYSSRGHQIMPAMAFSSGKLTVAWYDFRNNDLIATYTPLSGGQYAPALVSNGGTPDFATYIADPMPPYSETSRRQTIDVRAAQATPGNPPVFQPSVQVSQYAFGSTADNPGVIQQLEVNAPNLPMFQLGTLPFIGDYIDVAGPTFIPAQDGSWRYNNLPSDPDFTHVVWTDNRNVVQPADGNWAHYTPPAYSSATGGDSTTSLFDPTQQRPVCSIQTGGNTGDRNQDIYTAQLTSGLMVSARGNAKNLGKDQNGKLIQRSFPVTVQNATAQTRYYRLTIPSQPAGGAASFIQFPTDGIPYPFTQITVQVPGLSSSSRAAFITSTDPHATVVVGVAEVSGINGDVVPGGQAAALTLNGDISNPNISNPNISNPNISNPNISNTEIYNPNISNPNISNPNISNPNISNPNISNPNISNPNISNVSRANPNISNPNISNPNISNPNISNPNISNASLTDATWTVTNTGNTAAAYSIKMLAGKTVPPNVNVQLILSQAYDTPAVIGCNQAVQQHFVPVANFPDVVFYSAGSIQQPSATDPNAPAVSLLPGETAFVTMRVLDSTTSDPAQALDHFNPATATAPAVVSHAANTGTTTPPIGLVILPVDLRPATATAAYSKQLTATGGSGTYSWSVTGALPPGMALSPAGLLAGSPVGQGSFTFSANVTSGTQSATIRLTLAVAPPPSVATAFLNPGDQGLAGSQQLIASGGVTPIVWSATGLPGGVSLSPSGLLSGTPTVAGTFSPAITLTDANGATASYTFSLTISPAAVITTTTLPKALQGTPYSQSLIFTGGTGPLFFTAITVDGLTLSPLGLLSGIPTAAGAFPITVTLKDAIGAIVTRDFTLTVESSLALASTTLPPATQGVPYPPQQLLATGGSGTYPVWAVSSGTLPAGLSLSSSGVIRGTPTGSGTSAFTVAVTDSLGDTARQAYTIAVTGSALVGGAQDLGGGAVRLTSDFSQLSAVWSGVRQPVASAFSATFQFRVTAFESIAGDGFAFVIQNSPSADASLGGGGGGIGYGGLPNSLAIEFDTFGNYDNGDPNDNHIAILSNGVDPNSSTHLTATLNVVNPNPGITFVDGNLHNVSVVYAAGTLSVFLDGSQAPAVSTKVDLGNLLGLPDGKAWVGFTGSTGSNREQTDLSPLTFTPIP